METIRVRRSSRFASITRLWRSRFDHTRDEYDAADHDDSDHDDSDHDAAESAWSGERTEYFSPRIAAMIMKRRQGLGGVEHAIKFSKVHRSTVVLPTVEEAKLDQENRAVFRSLCNDPRWVSFLTGGRFFIGTSYYKVGGKIAEGGQAEIFEVEGRDDVVLKVFKKGYPLSQLQGQWPEALLRGDVVHICQNGIMLEDGRFAFMMLRAWGDLRKFIDLAMEGKNMQGPPFPFELDELNRWIYSAKYLMYCIASKMAFMHLKGVFHRDLKASNILLSKYANFIMLADFESSIGVEGTGFWRAPEVLLALKNKVRLITFTAKMDVYGFAMTCYEIVTGRLPFEGELQPIPSNYDLVMESGGVRPRLPSDLESGVRDLIVRCWDWDPNVRPTFAEIEAMSIFDEVRSSM